MPQLRLLALGLALVLLTVRLGSLTEEVFVTPVEDALFGVAFIDDNSNNSLGGPSFIKSKSTPDCDLPRCQMTVKPALPLAVTRAEYTHELCPVEVVFEIYFPPEPSSASVSCC